MTDPSSIHALHCVRHETYRLDSGKLAFTAVLTSPMLLRTLFLLENPHYIKLATDATWKDLFQDWCLMPIGVLSKQYAVSRYSAAKLPSWSTHFSEVLLLVSTTESKQAYAIGFEIFSKLKLQAQPPLLAGPNVRQVHADWSPAVENARQRVFPHSIRASDYAHMWLNMKSRVSHLPDSQRSDLKSALSRSRTRCPRWLGPGASGLAHDGHILLSSLAGRRAGSVWPRGPCAYRGWQSPLRELVGDVRQVAAGQCKWQPISGSVSRIRLACGLSGFFA